MSCSCQMRLACRNALTWQLESARKWWVFLPLSPTKFSPNSSTTIKSQEITPKSYLLETNNCWKKDPWMMMYSEIEDSGIFNLMETGIGVVPNFWRPRLGSQFLKNSCHPNRSPKTFMATLTLPETNELPLKMDGWNTTFLLGRPIFRCNSSVSGRVGPRD